MSQLPQRKAGREDEGKRRAGQAPRLPPPSGGAARDSAAPDTARNRPAYEPTRLDVAITVQKDRPKGQVVLRNARVITLDVPEGLLE